MHTKIIRIATTIHRNSQFEMLTRFGYISNGILHGLIGLAVMSLVFGAAEEVDQSGVLSPLTHSVYGVGLLILICLGLISLGLSHIVRLVLIRRKPHADRKWPELLAEMGKGLAYLIVGFSSLTYIFAGTHIQSSIDASVNFAAYLLAIPVGAALLFILGLAVLVLGINFIYRGAAKKFSKSLDFTKIRLKRPVIVLGVVGYIAKGLTFVSLGYLFCQAALTLNPLKASGLDGVFKSMISFVFGAQIVLLLGIGFIVYAVYCVIRGVYAKL